MIALDEYLISDSVLTTRFACDLLKCKGACCVEGLAGPPVTPEEIDIIREIYPKIKHRLRPEGVKVIEEKGISEVWESVDVLTCVNDKECVFVTFDDKGIAKCGIEQAYYAGEIKFQKPMSCHLFPIRVRDFFGQKALNVVESDDCKPAFKKGKEENIPLVEFLTQSLVRKFGHDFTERLTAYIKKNKGK